MEVPETIHNIKQINSFDCGVFIGLFARYISYNIAYFF